MGDTTIEWTEKTWNPVRGCSILSPGCHNCYAMGMAARFSDPGMWGAGYARFSNKRLPQWTGKVSLVAKNLSIPLSWKEPQLVFVNSTSDLFHESLTFMEIAAVFGVMAQTPRHTYQVLTKRSKRMLAFYRWLDAINEDNGPPPDDTVSTCATNYIDLDHVERPWPLPNVHIGVSVEDQERADERISDLVRIPAAIRFLSCEPLLGPVTIGLMGTLPKDDFPNYTMVWERIGWVIVGSESGPRRRPMETAWARAIVDECLGARVPVFTKQIATPGHAKGGDPAHWPPGDWPRQFPEAHP